MGTAIRCLRCGKEVNSDEGLTNCPDCLLRLPIETAVQRNPIIDRPIVGIITPAIGENEPTHAVTTETHATPAPFGARPAVMIPFVVGPVAGQGEKMKPLPPAKSSGPQPIPPGPVAPPGTQAGVSVSGAPAQSTPGSSAGVTVPGPASNKVASSPAEVENR